MFIKTLRTIIDESVILISIFKWIFLATSIGVLVGASTTLFLNAITLTVNLVNDIPYYYFGLPIVMAICITITTHVSPDSEGHGTEKVIRAVHKHQGKIRFRVIPLKTIMTLMTIMFGGSVGKEGPCAQIGAGLSSFFSDLFKFSKEDRKKLVICGVSAGFAGVFGTPIAGAIFGVEVLFVGNLLYSVLLPSLISGIASYQTAHFLGIHHKFHLIELPFSIGPDFFIYVGIAGILFGIISVTFIEFMNYFKQLADSIKVNPVIKGALGGLVVVLGATIFSTSYLGLGLDTIDSILTGKSVLWYAFLVKICLTSVTLGFGGSGGIITPLFFIGATSGSLIGSLLGQDPVVFAAIGMASVLAGAANTPIAACVLAIELFGPALAPYATVACVLSFFMTGYRSVFPSQIISSNKSSEIVVRRGDEIQIAETHYGYKTRRIMVSGRHFARRVLKENYKNKILKH